MSVLTEDTPALLSASSKGDAPAVARLTELVYAEMRRIAANFLHRERAGHTLQPTALVHETYLRLLGQTQVDWQSREHFLSVAARMMRRILIDYSRGRKRLKRGAEVRLSLSEAERFNVTGAIDFTALDEALSALESLDAHKSRVVELRYFAGLTIDETARVLNISTATVERDWRFAKAFLHRELAQT